MRVATPQAARRQPPSPRLGGEPLEARDLGAEGLDARRIARTSRRMRDRQRAEQAHHLRRRDIREGLALAERAAELEPGTPEAWHLVSVLRYLDGDYLLAAEAARHAIELAAQSPSPPADLARYQQQETTCNLALSVFSPLD